MEKSKEKAVVYMVYSSLFLSLLNFSVKGCIGPLGVAEAAFLRYFAPLVLIFPLLLRKKNFLRPHIPMRLHFLRGLFAAIAQLSLTYYLTQATLANATMLWATAPLYVPFIARFFYKQKTPLVTWFSIAICLIGVVMMIKPTDGIFDPFSIWGVIAGVATAGSQTLWGRNAERGSIAENLFYLYVFATLFMVGAWLILGNEGKGASPATPWLWISILGIAVASIGNQIFRSKAYQIASSTLLTPILYVAVVGAGLIDVIVYDQWPDFWGYIGFGFVAIGTLIKWWYLRKYYWKTL